MGSCYSTNQIKNSTNKIKYNKKNIPKALKRMVWDKYIGENVGKAKCLCCKHQDIRQIEFHCGHVIAEVNKGKTNIANLRPICAQCNLSMGSINMDLFIKKYMVI
jgi:5-methylcytosine-specific restriction endonuclease McrA